jgi:hypothetical protein
MAGMESLKVWRAAWEFSVFFEIRSLQGNDSVRLRGEAYSEVHAKWCRSLTGKDCTAEKCCNAIMKIKYVSSVNGDDMRNQLWRQE